MFSAGARETFSSLQPPEDAPLLRGSECPADLLHEGGREGTSPLTSGSLAPEVLLPLSSAASPSH